MSAVYWGLTGLSMMGKDSVEGIDKPALVEWVLSCQHEDGGFGGNIDQDSHMLYTLSALQILALCDALDRVDFVQVEGYIAGLQQEDGSFFGDKWGEVDTRFTYCALSALSIMARLWDSSVDVNKAAEYFKNFDGGFGCMPGAESHAGQIFTCVGALSIAKRLDLCDVELLGWWLSERQCDSGGCKVSWMNSDALVNFILQCQDLDDGGISDRPGNCADVFHTFFGVAGLSLLGYFKDKPGFEHYRQIDPVYALPVDVVQRLSLESQILP
eukprot:CAMPEP_0117814382 /NCGR_PEP_ID=MMETSP0948-20121206/24109_1 /TAXON_ID=44440 /ORGANISM="Chattonella subsalsa, Strain CCMP2191" /LENGTH=269 /DNA_ID=CAMNT_0005651995 /DNA_START=44 /DNA_END=854 /DNA_ORIENTATION=-